MEKNKYLLTMMVAERAKQLSAGAKPLIKTESKNQVAIAFKRNRRREGLSQKTKGPGKRRFTQEGFQIQVRRRRPGIGYQVIGLERGIK